MIIGKDAENNLNLIFISIIHLQTTYKSCLVLAQFNLSLMFNEKTIAILTEPVWFLLVIYPHTTSYGEA